MEVYKFQAGLDPDRVWHFLEPDLSFYVDMIFFVRIQHGCLIFILMNLSMPNEMSIFYQYELSISVLRVVGWNYSCLFEF